MQADHDFGWTGVCRYCGVTQEAVEDNVASANCDVLRQVMTDWWLLIPGALGLLIAVVLVGNVLTTAGLPA